MDFDKARDEAFKRLREERDNGRPLMCISGLRSSIIAQLTSYPCLVQVSRDLNVYPLYDAVAMWMDKKAGLARYFPEDMKRVANLLEL